MTKNKQQQIERRSSIDSVDSTISIKKQKKNYAVSITDSNNDYYKNSNNNNSRSYCCNDIKSCVCCCATKIGGMYSLVERKDGTPIIITGPSWPMCLFCTVPIIIASGFAITWFILRDAETNLVIWYVFKINTWWIIAIYLSFIIGTLLSLCFTSCSNPGLLERVAGNEDTEKGGWAWNEEVSSFQPPKSGYCKECKVLIEEYEHECCWTGTAIGRGNWMAFQLFLLFVNSLFYFSLGLIIFYVFINMDY